MGGYEKYNPFFCFFQSSLHRNPAVIDLIKIPERRIYMFVILQRIKVALRKTTKAAFGGLFCLSPASSDPEIRQFYSSCCVPFFFGDSEALDAYLKHQISKGRF